MSDSNNATSTIRMGPITIFTLLIIMCLATLSVLSLTTARASYAAADKQSAGVQATYAIESQGQEFCSQVDAQLAKTKAAGGDQTAAMSALKAQFGSQATIDGTTITIDFTQDTRTLEVQLEVRSNLTYQVTEWMQTSSSDSNEQLNLWSGK